MFSEVINGWETLDMAEQFGYFKEPRVSVTCKQWFCVCRFFHI